MAPLSPCSGEMFSIHSANCKLNSKPLLQLKGRASQSEGGGEPAADHGWGAFWKRSLSQLGTGSWGLLPTGTLRPALSLSPGDKGIGARRSRSGPLAFFPTCHEQGPACCHSPEAAGAQPGQCGHCSGDTDQAGRQVGGMRSGRGTGNRGTERSPGTVTVHRLDTHLHTPTS